MERSSTGAVRALAVTSSLLLAACAVLPGPGGGADGRIGGGAGGGGGVGVACTMIGCEDSVTFELSQDLVTAQVYEVEACVGSTCRSATMEVPEPQDGPFTGRDVGDLTLMADSDTIVLRLPDGAPPGTTHRVSLRVATADGAATVLVDEEREVDFEEVRPNGPDCPPVCRVARVSL